MAVPPVVVHDLRVNGRTEPLGFDDPLPRFSWAVEAATTAAQSHHQVQVFADADLDDATAVWDSGRVEDAQPFGVPWPQAGLRSRTRYTWRARVWLADGSASGWSDPTWFETGLLDPADWTARWITGSAPAGPDDSSVLYLNRVVTLPDAVTRARAYVTSLGWYHLFVNGIHLTADTIVPRWSPPAEFVEYQVYDLTAAFTSGHNAIAIAVGDGRYRGRLGVKGTRNHFGDRLAALAQFELQLADGSMVTVGTDTSWAAGPGRILAADHKTGEVVDLRIPDEDWLTGLRPQRFSSAELLPTNRVLVAEQADRVRDVIRLGATVSVAPSGRQLLDVGQNITGYLRLRLRGPAGAVVRITHAELLGPDGELDDRNLALMGTRLHQRDVVTLDGDEHWHQPRFALRGFRYVEVDGLPHRLDPADVEAVVISSDMRTTGEFACSDPRVEQLYRNVVWSMRGNFLEVPMDCPTRERSGWTGDAQVFAPTATRLMDVQAFYRRYLRVLAAEQRPDGRIPVFVPDDDPRDDDRGGVTGFFQRHGWTVAGWGDACVLIPWALHEAYGDVGVLEEQWPTMQRWVGLLERTAAAGRGRARWFARRLGEHDRYILGGGFHFGEWLRPGENAVPSVLRTLVCPPAAVATAYFAHSARTLGRIAQVLGRDADARRYHALADRVGAAWRAAFVRKGGARIGADRQDDYVRALAFDLLDPAQRPAALDRLVELIRAADTHLGTGFLSTAMLLPTLARHGRTDVAGELLLRDTVPSWLHQVSRGATTTWESWEGYDEDGRGKDSHNHFAYGAVAAWLVDGLAGLAPAAPAYRRIRVDPAVGGGITSARAAVDTPYGRAASSWVLEDGVVTLRVCVPRGTTAEVHLGPGCVETADAGEHKYRWTVDPPAALLDAAGATLGRSGRRRPDLRALTNPVRPAAKTHVDEGPPR